MNDLNRKYFIYLIVTISFIAYIAMFQLFKEPESLMMNYIKPLTTVVTIDLILVSIFAKWVWKWKILQGWLVLFPNLNGTWKGFIQSTWQDPKTGNRPGPIPVILTIDQSFFNISCVMRTAEMTSYSFVAKFFINKDIQQKQLVYSYNSDPKSTVKDRSPQHYGTMIFEIIDTPKRVLQGGYWTGRKTTGHIELEFWKEEKFEYYPNELGEHPVSKIREGNS